MPRINFKSGGNTTMKRMVRGFAWQRLGPEKQKLLDQQRDEGLFGGDFKPHYWNIQNVGMPSVGIPGTQYVSRALASFRADAPAIVARVMGGL